MIINGRNINSISKVTSSNVPLVKKQTEHKNGRFAEILGQKLGTTSRVKFSKHAEMRLNTRNIELTGEQKERIGRAVQEAEKKGVKDSLVIMDDIAFVVNVKSRTVITAVNKSELKENVFTNIDGAVFT